MQLILETTTTEVAYDLFVKLGNGRIVAYDRCPVEECNQYETENFDSITIEVEPMPESEEK